MSEQTEKVFADGIIFKLPRDGAPDFVKGSLSFKTEEAVKWLQDNTTNGWVNVDLKLSQGGKAYAELNTWKPKTAEPGNAFEKPEDIPF